MLICLSRAYWKTNKSAQENDSRWYVRALVPRTYSYYVNTVAKAGRFIRKEETNIRGILVG